MDNSDRRINRITLGLIALILAVWFLANFEEEKFIEECYAVCETKETWVKRYKLQVECYCKIDNDWKIQKLSN